MAEFDDQHSRVPESVFLVGIQYNDKDCFDVNN